MVFSDLGLSIPLVRAVADLDYAEPTPIQAAVIPAVLRGRDVFASAKTGSGKTAAFLLPLLNVLSRGVEPKMPMSSRGVDSALGPDFQGARKRADPHRNAWSRLSSSERGLRGNVRALIVVPTRELAAQIGEAIRNFGCRLEQPLKTCVVIGGISINPQMMALRGGADIVVATPGRLLDLVACNTLRLSAVQTLVLDEADRLLALGFADELAEIVALLPARRQNLLFSATFPAPIAELAEKHLHDPLRINLDAGAAPNATIIVQRAIEVDESRRTMLLRHLIETNAWSGTLVFVATKYGADHVAMKLNRAGITSSALHGELSQGGRTQALADFKAGRIRVLVATDVAARGIDVAELPAVVNYDLPRSPLDYVHRIGRTGRAGGTGVAISFVTAASDAHFRLIERKNRVAIEREQIAGFEPVELVVPPLDPNGGVKGKGKSKKDKLREAAARAAGAGSAAKSNAPTEPLFPWTPPSVKARR